MSRFNIDDYVNGVVAIVVAIVVNTATVDVVAIKGVKLGQLLKGAFAVSL